MSESPRSYPVISWAFSWAARTFFPCSVKMGKGCLVDTWETVTVNPVLPLRDVSSKLLGIYSWETYPGVPMIH